MKRGPDAAARGAWGCITALAKARDLFNRARWRHTKAPRRRQARIAASHRFHHAIAQIVRTGSRHDLLASFPADRLNQKTAPMGIRPRFKSAHSRSKRLGRRGVGPTTTYIQAVVGSVIVPALQCCATIYLGRRELLLSAVRTQTGTGPLHAKANMLHP